MRRFQITVNGAAYDVQVEELASGGAPAAISVPAATPAPVSTPTPAPAPAPVAPAGATQVLAPMPGNILDIKANAGDAVSRGTVLLILEAMKMENEITAPADGTIAAFHVKKGDSVDTGALLVSLK